jgi:hypothetical protein
MDHFWAAELQCTRRLSEVPQVLVLCGQLDCRLERLLLRRMRPLVAGTFRTWRDVRLESVMRLKADIGKRSDL